MTKQEKIEKLIQMEWEDFQKVNNEGGRASCQDDPETFFIMRRSHFAPWTEELIDCVQADMDRAHEQGRNLVMEKYAWMMASTAPEQFKKLQHFLIDNDTRRVFVGKEEIDLTQTEYNIMAFLSVHAGKVLTYAAIIRAVWGYSDYGSVKKLQVNMKNIRKKMGVTPGEKRYIINELGVGYRMLAEDEA